MAKKGTLPGLLIGGAIGAVSALLLAPKPGKEMRADLTNRYNGLCESTSRVAGNVTQTASDLVRTASDKASTVLSSAKDTLHTAKSAGEDVLDEAKDGLDSAKETVVDEAKSMNKSDSSY
ncbi:YtxH domain-containing protein [Gorillibacterium timonense]|uniref:YtxH domain-containing protein n=1 Tax=Gorillibacterium timonense TaxID=1689269 RepID=UPI00071DBBEF|nr:YtxH domain-containing protein [Gorillibacterium timonense]